MSVSLRAILCLFALLIVIGYAPVALAHASLVLSAPSDGAVLAQAPESLGLVFNEPVAPLVMRLIGPNGEVIVPAVKSDNDAVVLTPPRPLRQGTYAVSWRVVSADGHPVSGAYVFSIGTPSGAPQAGAQPQGDPAVHAGVWAARLVVYVGLFFGIGGAFFRTWIADPPMRKGSGVQVAALGAGLAAIVLSVGLLGLDALERPPSDLADPSIWGAGLATSYGWTAGAAVIAATLALVSLQWRGPRPPRSLSLLALIGVGLALSLSGHAATAAPRLVTVPSVFLHGVCVAVWIGALLPLLTAARAGEGAKALARFSRAIPYPLAVLVVTGVTLAFVQLDRFDALWTTDYGTVLFRKLVFVALLLALGAANRYWLVPRFEAAGARALRPFALSLAAESVLALVILGLVALWRFTPPPRAIVPASAAVSVHFHGARAMVQIDIVPERARPAHATVEVFDGKEKPLKAKEVALVLSKPDSSIEPMRRELNGDGSNAWRLDDLRIPIGGVWRLRVEVLIDDFEKAVLEDNITLPRAP